MRVKSEEWRAIRNEKIGVFAAGGRGEGFICRAAIHGVRVPIYFFTGDEGPFLTGQKWAKKPPEEGSRRVSGYALNPHTALPRTPGFLRGPLEEALR